MRIKHHTRTIRLGLSVGLIFASSGHFFESASSSRTATALPRPVHPAQELNPEGLGLIQVACVQCHDLSLVFSQQKSADVWEETIARMIWRGAALLPGEAEIIEDYLVSDYNRNLPPSQVAPEEVVSQLPEGLGKTLVVEACVGCHDLSPILSRGRTDQEWRGIVEAMVRLGSPLAEGEPDIVIEYLSTSFRR